MSAIQIVAVGAVAVVVLGFMLLFLWGLIVQARRDYDVDKAMERELRRRLRMAIEHEGPGGAEYRYRLMDDG